MKPLDVLGINCAYHESSACLLRDGRIVAAAEEERFSRVKHAKPAAVDNPDELPWQAIRFCLAAGGITLGEVAHAGYSLDPHRRLANSRFADPVVEGDWGSAAGERTFHQRALRVPELLRGQGFSGSFHWLGHHDCHAASAFYPSPFADAAVLTVDGIGETASTSFAMAEGRTITTIQQVEYPSSLGFVWEKLSAFLGFSPYDAAKVMGLAAYGDPAVYHGALDAAVAPAEDGGFRVDGGRLLFRVEEFAPLEELFGLARRRPGEPLTAAHADIAAALQRLTDEVLLHMIRHLHRRTGARNLCLAGGVALNCVSNRVLFEEGPFARLYIQPATHDAGTAIGAAAAIWHGLLGGTTRPVMDHAYLGPTYREEDITAAARAAGLPHRRAPDIAATVARLLAEGNIVGWFQGAMELGPRALGNRSLLADPRDPHVRGLLNVKVKHREEFRPFAPSVTAEEAERWFAIRKPTPAAEFMLVAYPVRAEQRARIPAVTHIDGSSRIHIVRREANPRYHALLRAFQDRTGVPVLLNTSFNDDEPIVCSPADALATFTKTDIDLLALGDTLVWKPGRTAPV